MRSWSSFGVWPLACLDGIGELGLGGVLDPRDSSSDSDGGGSSSPTRRRSRLSSSTPRPIHRLQGNLWSVMSKSCLLVWVTFHFISFHLLMNSGFESKDLCLRKVKLITIDKSTHASPGRRYGHRAALLRCTIIIPNFVHKDTRKPFPFSLLIEIIYAISLTWLHYMQFTTFLIFF